MDKVECPICHIAKPIRLFVVCPLCGEVVCYACIEGLNDHPICLACLNLFEKEE
jgi:hypothetical protein